jgi:hypothetical protein
MCESSSIETILENKIASSHSDFDKAEYTVMLCKATKDLNPLYKLFGIDKKKLQFEVEKTTGKKTHHKPEPEKQNK